MAQPVHRIAPRPPGERTLLGRTIGGKYGVRGILGEGGMGTVFDAVHLVIGRPVAIKVLRPTHARVPGLVERFHREARAVSRVDHPNVCAVHDLGTLEDGRPYLVMERLVGETLEGAIGRRGRLPCGEAVDIVIQMLSALGASHRARVIHRDIKPDNVFLVGREGCSPLVKLLDFGVSKTIAASAPGDEEPDLTRRGMVMGTPHYMSPEQARGDRDVDARTDLYSCGVALYEVLTGQRPYSGPSHAAILREVLRGMPRPAHELCVLPSELEIVLCRAMDRDRSRRYADAAEFQRALLGCRRNLHSPPPLPPRLAPGLARTVSPPAPANATPTRVWRREAAPRSSDDTGPTLLLAR